MQSSDLGKQPEPTFSPKLRDARDQINVILKENDIAAVVVLYEEGMSEFNLHVETTKSCIRLEGDALRFRSKLADFNGDKEAQHASTEYTVGMIRHFMDLVSLLAWQHVNLFGKFDFGAEMGVDLEGMAACFNDPNCWNRVLNNNPS